MMATEHTVGFEPADGLAKDRESVRRRFWIKLKRVAARLPFAEDLLAAYYCAFDKETPRHVQATLLGAIAYFILPFDFIPDMLPVLGFTDDAAVLATAIRLVATHITPEHRDAARAALKRGGRGGLKRQNSSRESQCALPRRHHGCRITLPIALRPASTFRASAVCASGKVRSTCDEILPSAVHFTSFSRLARFFSGLSRAQCAPEHAADIAALQQRQIERHLRNVAGGESDHQEAAFPGDRAQRGLGIAAADRIENNIGALAAGEPPQAFLEIFLGVVQAEFGAVRFGEFKLLVRRCAGDHLQAHQLAEFAGRQTGAAGSAEHRQGLARLSGWRDLPAHAARCRR